MVRILHDHNNCQENHITLPLAPSWSGKTMQERSEIEIYARFMRHLRLVPNKRVEIKILSAIQFTADMMNIADELVSKILVDLGLRAPRCAFPSAYLKFADDCLKTQKWDVERPTNHLMDLRQYWNAKQNNPCSCSIH